MIKNEKIINTMKSTHQKEFVTSTNRKLTEFEIISKKNRLKKSDIKVSGNKSLKFSKDRRKHSNNVVKNEKILFVRYFDIQGFINPKIF